ncbi:hypothetical protein FRB99_007870 [Tulasnella sp. 403]|nr:hypothetical protein FRB99_007870 [Tulasnella sp. 403]
MDYPQRYSDSTQPAYYQDASGQTSSQPPPYPPQLPPLVTHQTMSFTRHDHHSPNYDPASASPHTAESSSATNLPRWNQTAASSASSTPPPFDQRAPLPAVQPLPYPYPGPSQWPQSHSNDQSYQDPYARAQERPPSPPTRPAAPTPFAFEPPSANQEPPQTDQPSDVSGASGSRPRRTGLWALVDAPDNNRGNPGYSIKILMEYAIKGSPKGRLSLQEIYQAVEERYPIFATPWGANWRNSARHDISMDPRFINIPRPPNEPGKGGLWMFDPDAPPKPSKPRRKKSQVGKVTDGAGASQDDASPSVLRTSRQNRPREPLPYNARGRRFLPPANDAEEAAGCSQESSSGGFRSSI